MLGHVALFLTVQNQSGPLTCMLCCLSMIVSLDSLLMRHLLPSLWSALQLSLFHSLTFTQALVGLEPMPQCAVQTVMDTAYTEQLRFGTTIYCRSFRVNLLISFAYLSVTAQYILNVMCCDMGQNDTIGKIELNPLSSCQVIILNARMTFNCSSSCLMS